MQKIRSVADLDFTPRGPVFPSPLDWRDVFIYQILIDRFDDEKDRPLYQSDAAKTPRDSKQGMTFQGGTLRGIARRLDYLKNMGVTAIWISPPLKNRPGEDQSYHGYGAQDFLSIDPHFGKLEDFQNLVREAHARQIYVIMDIVIDHSGDVWAYGNDEDFSWNDGEQFPFGFWRKGNSNQPLKTEPGPDDAVWPIELQSPAAYKRMGRMRDINTAQGAEVTDGDFETMKVLDLENPRVLETIIRIYKYWIAVADVDGFRIDAFRHLRPDAAARFCYAIREFATKIGKKNFIQIGEMTGGNANMIRLVGLNTPLPEEGKHAHFPMLDATLDFAMHDILAPVLLGEKAPIRLHGRYEFLARYYRDFGEVGKNYVTFVENHDFGAVFRKRLQAGENDPRLGILAATFLLTSLGVPCWYYGSEQGFDGDGKAHDCFIRECMFGGKWGAFGMTELQFFDSQNPIYQAIAKLAKLRSEIPALRFGRQYIRPISTDGVRFNFSDPPPRTLAYSRILDDQEIVIAMNVSKQSRADFVLIDSDLSPPGTVFNDVLDSSHSIISTKFTDGVLIQTELPPRTARIYIRKS